VTLSARWNGNGGHVGIIVSLLYFIFASRIILNLQQIHQNSHKE